MHNFLFGVVLGYILHTIQPFFIEKFKKRLLWRQWKQADSTWKSYQAILSGFELIQPGWSEGLFSEKHIVLTVEKKKMDFPLEIGKHVLDKEASTWFDLGLRNNLLIGLYDIDPFRISEDSSSEAHRLRLRAHRYKYFQFLSTNRIFCDGNSEHNELIQKYVAKKAPLHPIPEFANPLSVGLALFCEDGMTLVLTCRTEKESSSGIWEPGAIFNAVGENMNEQDKVGTYRGKDRFSPWKTAARGLKEEMGFKNAEIEKYDICLHSFVWDKRLLDYMFFGYVISDLSRSQIERQWLEAEDRHENKNINFVSVKDKSDCLTLLEDIKLNRDKWSLEALFSTLRTLIITRKVEWSDIEHVFSSNSDIT